MAPRLERDRPSSRQVISVSLLTAEISRLLDEGIGTVTVRGEISNYKEHSSGHRYFTLKDEGAQIAAVLWRGRSIRFTPKDGMLVVATGSVSVYPPMGRYQIDCVSLEPLGIGDLNLAFEALKQKLQALGWFDVSRKKRLPKLPMKVGVATSPTGAAVHDIVSTMRRRNPACVVVFRPCKVQGDGSAEDIVAAIRELDRQGCDVLIVGRGGGSIEDLWSYNTEIVADALFHCKTPVISAVGHESDVTIADFVADLRAATPTAAAEMVTPLTQSDLIAFIGQVSDRLARMVARKLDERRRELGRLVQSAALRRFPERIHMHMQRIDQALDQMERSLARNLERRTLNVDSLSAQLHALNPSAPMRKGFAMLYSGGQLIDAHASLTELATVLIVRQHEQAHAAILDVQHRDETTT